MFQNFDPPARAASSSDRVARLREWLAREGLAGYFVPHSDEYQGEYTPACAERLAWITGFTGSAGAAVILSDIAAIFVDGRYTLQAREQVDGAVFGREHLIEFPPHAWLKQKLKAGDKVGYDPRLVTVAELKRFDQALGEIGARFVAVDGNPIDAIWTDRPAAPVGAITQQPDELAGETVASKLARLDEALAQRNADAAVLVQSDSIAWAFNIRGADVAHNPVPLSYALLRRGGKPTLYVDGRKLSNAVRDALHDFVDIKEEAALGADLATLGTAAKRVLADPQTTPASIAAVIVANGGTIVEGQDPVVLPKARKNPVELSGSRNAHRRDGVAMTRFLAWLDKAAATGTLTEIAAAETLEAIRAENGAASGMPLAEISFDTISGAGPNAAIPHYRVNRSTDRTIEPNSIYLVDSGGQYRDGTTDITRTIIVGTPTAEMRDRFTRVLKGHIAVATARFPAGTNGIQIDALARNALWQAGLDFDHGTGHGVGSYLSVHEGPARLSKASAIPLEPGMILSNEPGYYKSGAWGIRIENLLIVTPAAPIPGGDREMLGFETLTLAPIDRRLVEPDLMTPAEIDWFNAYHLRVRDALLPSLEGADRDFLIAATQPITG